MVCSGMTFYSPGDFNTFIYYISELKGKLEHNYFFTCFFFFKNNTYTHTYTLKNTYGTKYATFFLSCACSLCATVKNIHH